MMKKELEETNATYAKNVDDWEYYGLSYRGGKAFVEDALGDQNSRESRSNWQERIDSGYSFNYCAAIIDLFNFYLTEKPAVRELKPLEKDPQWQMFLNDSNLSGVNFDEWIIEGQKLASAYGSIGILVDKPVHTLQTVEQEI